jgi:hypothetical protein
VGAPETQKKSQKPKRNPKKSETKKKPEKITKETHLQNPTGT